MLIKGLKNTLIDTNVRSNLDLESLSTLVFNFKYKRNYDERGQFSRLIDIGEVQREFTISQIEQVSFSRSKLKGTRRGIHVQGYPHSEGKFVTVISGSIYDVIVDLRINSRTFGSWISFELDDSNEMGIYVPPGFGHAIQTLKNDSTVLYAMTASYDPNRDFAVNSNDPDLSINWPSSESVISEKDKNAMSLKKFIEIN